MNLHDFYYDLPQELIAQDPLEDRSSSRLMVLDQETGHIEHHIFREIIDYLNPGDCLVVNNTKVIPARLMGSKVGTDAHIEVLLLKRNENDVWETLVKPGKKAKPGTKISFGDGLLVGEVLDVVEDGNRMIKFTYEGIFEEILDQLGQMPLPPYITHQLKDKNRYQTVYAKHEGSAAAPTAGLHFTPELLQAIKDKGVNIAHVTLHVGLGTFRPVKVENILEHHMHSEFYMVEEDQAKLINETKKNGGRIIAVGTTSCRTLESATGEDGILKAGSGWTEIFIYPGYQFKLIDCLITNFHLPESTLMMLVSALAGRDKIMAAYEEAVKERYRFFSFGDAEHLNKVPGILLFLLQYQLDLGSYHIKGHIIHTAVDDHICQRTGGLYIQIMHGLNCSQILLHNIVQVTATFFNVADNTAKNPFICISFYIDFNIHHVAESGIFQQQDTFCQNDLLWLNVNGLVRTVVHTVIVDRTVYSNSIF